MAALATPPDPAERPDPEIRTRRFLTDESVIWLSTVRDDGLPHLVPVWFWWDGETITVWSKPHAVKVRALRAHPRAMVALGEPDHDFDVGMLEARAEIVDGGAPIPPGFFAKYRSRMPAGRLDPETFAATYRQAIRLTPTRWLAWHGRSPRPLDRSARPVGRPAHAEPSAPVGAGVPVSPWRSTRPSFRHALERIAAAVDAPRPIGAGA